MPAINLTIDQLLLHSDNPRIGSAANQRDALQKIIDDQGAKLAELADSINEDGLSPIERLLVIHEKKNSQRYIAHEGNRRVAVLKILSNPNVLSDLEIGTQLQRRLEKAANEFDRSTVEPIACYAAKDDSEANKWIYLRHTGENEGRGVVPWSGMARARFRGTDPALQALDFVREHGGLAETQKTLLSEGFPITTLDRLLSTKEVRQLIGVDVKDHKLRSGLVGEQLIKPLRRMVLDLAEKRVNVSDLKNKAAQLLYIKQFGRNDIPDLTVTGTIRDVQDYKNSEFKGKKAAASKSKAYDSSSRKMLIDKKSKLNITDNKVAEIAKELRGLRMEDYPHSCAVLFRVFLELSIDTYMDTNSMPTTFKPAGGAGRTVDKKLDAKIREVIEHLVNIKDVKRKELGSMTRAINDKDGPLFIDLLHAYVHNRFVTPKIRDLRSAWNDAQRFFEGVWA